MSAQALQRVVVRLLHDPDLDRATRGAGLTATQRRWLERTDPRRWRADPMRRYRLLQTLIEEYPVSVALSVRAQDVAGIDRFFESACFHDGVQNRSVLALDFGAWLISNPPPNDATVVEHARIEHAIAQVRRVPAVRHPADPARRWQLAPWIAVGRGPVDAWQQMRIDLLAHSGGLTVGILDPTFGVHCKSSAITAWMVDGSGDPKVEALPKALSMVLEALRRPLGWADCIAALTGAGADLNDADDLLRALIDDVLLTAVAD